MSGLGTFIAATSLMNNVYQGVSAKWDRDAAEERQKAANAKAEQEAKDQAEQSQQNINRANQKAPDVSSMLAVNQGGATGGSSASSRGRIDSLLNLGGNSLLGMGLGNNNVRRR